jgi:hypothetical protein
MVATDASAPTRATLASVDVCQGSGSLNRGNGIVRKRCLRLAASRRRVDCKTDYILVGRSWTFLDDASSKTANSRAIWTWLDDFGQRAACSKTAGCRFDSCPTCPRILNSSGLQPCARSLYSMR